METTTRNDLTDRARFFLAPDSPLHRQYEALRAYFVERLPSLIPSDNPEPFSSGKTEPLGPVGVAHMAPRARVAPLGTPVQARSEGRPGVVA